jgi:thioredoxin 1
MAEITINDQNFKSEIEDFKGLALVDFWAEWCGPCRMQGPIIEELAADFADDSQIKIGKINVDENPIASQTFGVRSIPSLKFFKDGQVVDELIGVNPKEVLKQKIEELSK